MTDEITVGLVLKLSVRAMAHGGEGIADAPDGRVVFIAGAIPGDTVEAQLARVKKRWARAELVKVVDPSPHRVRSACPAAAAGAGCCDFAHIDPAVQVSLKRDVLLGQLGALASKSGVVEADVVEKQLRVVELDPRTGWRTRVRMGVDPQGRAGMRALKSSDVVGGVVCSQVAPQVLDGIIGDDAARYTPGSEIVAVVDSRGKRHVVETQSAQRGRRVERIHKVLEGPGLVTEVVDGHEFSFPPTAFWQAHLNAAQTYSDLIKEWGSDNYTHRNGWDLYGGVGAFVPAINEAIGGGRIDSVDYSASATANPQPVEDEFDVHRHNAKVEVGISELPAPGLVVLDPPRSGAGRDVVDKIAQAAPERIIHIGCDPATFARDLAGFGAHGFRVEHIALIDAFPNTHHFEVMASLVPDHNGGAEE